MQPTNPSPSPILLYIASYYTRWSTLLKCQSSFLETSGETRFYSERRSSVGLALQIDVFNLWIYVGSLQTSAFFEFLWGGVFCTINSFLLLLLLSFDSFFRIVSFNVSYCCWFESSFGEGLLICD